MTMKTTLPTLTITTIIQTIWNVARLTVNTSANNTITKHSHTTKMPTLLHPHQSHQHVNMPNTSPNKHPAHPPAHSHPPYPKHPSYSIPDMSSPEYPSVLSYYANGNKPFGFNMDQLNYFSSVPRPIMKIG